MGAPYLLKLPTGETLISYQTNENRASDWEYSTMEVAIGDKTARNFNRRTRPFDVPLDKEAKWNSLAMWDENTVVAFTSSDFKSKEVAPWLIKGYIIPEVMIQARDIESYPVFIGAKGETNLRAGMGADSKNLYITCKVKDRELFNSENSGSDGVFIYFNNGKQSTKVWYSYQGKINAWNEVGETWQAKPVDDILVSSSIKDSGYELNIIIPRKEIGSDKKEIRLGMALSAYNTQSGYTEMLVNSEENKPETWLKVKLGN